MSKTPEAEAALAALGAHALEVVMTSGPSDYDTEAEAMNAFAHAFLSIDAEARRLGLFDGAKPVDDTPPYACTVCGAKTDLGQVNGELRCAAHGKAGAP